MAVDQSICLTNNSTTRFHLAAHRAVFFARHLQQRKNLETKQKMKRKRKEENLLEEKGGGEKKRGQLLCRVKS